MTDKIVSVIVSPPRGPEPGEDPVDYVNRRFSEEAGTRKFVNNDLGAMELRAIFEKIASEIAPPPEHRVIVRAVHDKENQSLSGDLLILDASDPFDPCATCSSLGSCAAQGLCLHKAMEDAGFGA